MMMMFADGGRRTGNTHARAHTPHTAAAAAVHMGAYRRQEPASLGRSGGAVSSAALEAGQSGPTVWNPVANRRFGDVVSDRPLWGLPN